MEQILFVVDVPPASGIANPAGMPFVWQQFENAAKGILKTLPNGAVYQLQKNVWLIRASGTWQVLKDLSSTAETHKLSYSVSLVSGEVTHLTK